MRDMAILCFIADFQQHNGYSPNMREIGENTGTGATSVVSYNLDKLRRKGLIRWPTRTSQAFGYVRPARVLIITDAGHAALKESGTTE